MPKRAKKTALRLDGVQYTLGIDKLRVTRFYHYIISGRSKPLPYVRFSEFNKVAVIFKQIT